MCVRDFGELERGPFLEPTRGGGGMLWKWVIGLGELDRYEGEDV